MTDEPDPTNLTNRSGGADLNAEGDINIGGDVVGRDKIVQNISHIINNIAQRPLSAAEESEKARSLESQYLQQGVTACIQRLRDRVAESADTGGPFKGLMEYRLSDAAIFFGRTQAISDLSEHVQRSPLTILHAESGAGKTSLLLAGLSPYLLAAGHLPVYLRPYNTDPTLVIKRTFVANLKDTPNLAQLSLREFLVQVTSVLGPGTTLYLFLDQFEEFFTRLEEARRARFIEELAECLDDASLNVRWVLALRTEFFGNLANFRPRIRNPFENDYRLNRLTRAEAREVVAEPALQRGITFESGLVDTLLDDLGKDEIAPPQVQLVCSALCEALPSDSKIITRQMYADQHGAEGILHEHLSRVLNRDLPAEQRAVARHTLEALMTSDTHRVLRTRAELATEFTLHDINSETLDQVLNQLVDSRLLRVEEVDDQPAYELAHDYLLTEIKLDPTVQARKAAQELLEQEVRAYQRYGTVLSADKFAILAPRRHELVMNDDAQALLRKSERALRRRQGLVLGGVGLVAVLMVIGFVSIITALGARHEQQAAVEGQHIAETETAKAVVQKADALSSEATAQASRIKAQAEAAVAATKVAAANQILHNLFDKNQVISLGASPTALTFDGQQIWVATREDHRIQAIDPATGAIRSTITLEGSAPNALVSDGTRLWLANKTDNVVQAVNFTTGLIEQTVPVSYPIGLAYDGERLWVATNNNVQSINPATGAVNAIIPTGAIATNLDLIAFDGQRLWIGFVYSLHTESYYATQLRSIDPSTRKIDARPVMAYGGASIALSADGTRLWLADQSNRAVLAVQPDSYLTSDLMPVGNSPVALAYDTNRDRLWVANDRDNTLQVIDPARVPSQPIEIGGHPTGLASDGSRLWVTDASNNTLQAIDIGMGQQVLSVTLDFKPGNLAYDGSRLWVNNVQSHTLQAIDPATGALGTTFALDEVAVPRLDEFTALLVYDGTRLWVQHGSYLSSTIQAIDTSTGLVSTTVAASGSAIASDGQQLWLTRVGSLISDTVVALDPETGRMLASISGFDRPNALAFDGRNLWIANDAKSIRTLDPTTHELGVPLDIRLGVSRLFVDNHRLWILNDDNTVQYIVLHR